MCKQEQAALAQNGETTSARLYFRPVLRQGGITNDRSQLPNPYKHMTAACEQQNMRLALVRARSEILEIK